MGEVLTIWTIRISLVFYFLGQGTRLVSKGGRRRCRTARIFWTAGCLFLVVHVAAAFHFFHTWSHEVAYRDTAHQVSLLFGWAWGGGLYFNYALVLMWVMDVLWWWQQGVDKYETRSTTMGMILHGYLLFMVFNAAVVFEEGMIRWLVLCGILILFFLWWGTREGESRK